MPAIGIYLEGRHLGYTDEIRMTTEVDTEEISPFAGPQRCAMRQDLHIGRLRRELGPRPGWDIYFLDIARAVSQRGDCSRRRVGAVVVDAEHRIVSTGYNGVAAGEAGCLTTACARTKAASPCPGYSDCKAVHAEANAIIYAGRDGCHGATLYLTDPPCGGCRKLISAAGLRRVVWPSGEL